MSVHGKCGRAYRHVRSEKPCTWFPRALQRRCDNAAKTTEVPMRCLNTTKSAWVSSRATGCLFMLSVQNSPSMTSTGPLFILMCCLLTLCAVLVCPLTLRRWCFPPPERFASRALRLIIVWGQCNHTFHMHCVLKHLQFATQQNRQQQCPLCRQEWQFREAQTAAEGDS